METYYSEEGRRPRASQLKRLGNEEEQMKNNWRFWIAIGVISVLMLGWSGVAVAQGGAASGSAAGAAANTSMNKNIGYDTSPTSKENALELIKPADQKEEAAYKDFQAVSPEKPAKKIELGETFLQKYPQSGYRGVVLSSLTSAYLQTNQVQKMQETGARAIAFNPNDVQVLAMLGQTLPRVMNASTPEPTKLLEKAEQYSKRAIETVPTLTKPAGLSDQQFTQAKNQTLAIAHSGLGLVAFRRGDYAGAVTELNESVKLDPRGDATNYYVLGVANQNSKHFTEAAAAFGKCGEFSGSLQATCKDGAEKAKKLAAPQPDGTK